MSGIHQITYQVRPYEAGYQAKAKLDTLLNYLQDAAYEHSVSRGFSALDLFRRGLTWVLSRYHITIRRYPGAGQQVTVRTWYPGPQKPFYLRDWEVVGDAGDVLALATSSWLILDLATMKPVDDNGLLDGLKPRPVRALDDPFHPLPGLEAPHAEARFMVRLSDTDLNRHVNHVHYIQWAVESVSRLAAGGMVPLEVEAGYRAEARFEDNVTARAQDLGEGLFHHQLLRDGDQKELTRLRTRWGIPEDRAAT